MSTNLKTQRIARDLDQVELAALLGCTQSTVSHYETGVSRPRRKSVLGARLSAFFGVPLAELLAPSTDENDPR